MLHRRGREGAPGKVGDEKFFAAACHVRPTSFVLGCWLTGLLATATFAIGERSKALSAVEPTSQQFLEDEMQARMKNPAVILPGANGAIQALMASIYQSGVAKDVLDLVGLRVGQLNVCQLCIGQAMSGLEPGGKQAERLQAVGTWRNADGFTEAEQVALALAEAITDLDGRYDSVPDALWSDVERLYPEPARAGLVVFISAMNMFTRINVSTRQLTADWAA